MKPNSFLDVRIRQGLPSTSRAMAGVVGALHLMMAQAPDTLALAWPRAKEGNLPTPGHVLRIWGPDQQTLEEVAQRLKDNADLSPVITMGGITVLSSWSGPLIQYRRFRIPARRQKDPNPVRVEAQSRRRAAKLERAGSVPYLNIQSSSNKNFFRLMFEATLHESGSGSEGVGQSDSYGLSKHESPLWLPDMPE